MMFTMQDAEDLVRDVVAAICAPKNDLPKATMPSGICPRCHKPWDDHTQGACPKVTA